MFLQEKLSLGQKLLVANLSKDTGVVRHQYQAKEVSALVPTQVILIHDLIKVFGPKN